jgi:hypothetical protein
MTALGWLIRGLVAIAYLVIGALVWRLTAWWFADKARYDSREPFTPFEIVWGLVIGAVFAIVWPLTLVIWLASTRGVQYVGAHFLLPPRHVRREQLANDVAEQERRIAELERQVEMH